MRVGQRAVGELTVSVLTEPGADWTRLVGSATGGDVSQLPEWANLRATVGYRPAYLQVREDGELVAGAMVLHRRFGWMCRVGYVSYGPVVAAGCLDRAGVVALLVGALREYGLRRLTMLIVQPPDGAADVSEALLHRGFRPTPQRIAPVASIRIDLRPSEEELRLGLRNQRLRRRAKSGSVSGRIRVREGDADELVRLMGLSAAHQRFDPLRPDYVHAMIRELRAGGHGVLLVGEYDGTPVSALLLSTCGDTVKARLTGLDRDAAAPSGVSGLVHWEAIRWARRHGFRWFDFGGVSPSTVDAVLGRGDWSEVPGRDRFKIDFGGAVFRYPRPGELVGSRLVAAVLHGVRRSARGTRWLGAVERRLRAGHGAPGVRVVR